MEQFFIIIEKHREAALASAIFIYVIIDLVLVKTQKIHIHNSNDPSEGQQKTK